MCIGIFKYNKPLEIKNIIDRELRVRSGKKSEKSYMDRRQRCKNRTVLKKHIQKQHYIMAFKQ